MKITIETENGKEALRMQKSLDMICFIFDLVRCSKEEIECEWDKHQLKEPIDIFFEHINYLLAKHNINIDELLD